MSMILHPLAGVGYCDEFHSPITNQRFGEMNNQVILEAYLEQSQTRARRTFSGDWERRPSRSTTYHVPVSIGESPGVLSCRAEE